MYDRQKRKLELTDIMRSFEEKAADEKISFSYKGGSLESAVERILDEYGRLLNERLKEFHVEDTLVNIYKVASGLEISALVANVITGPGPIREVALNAELAFEIAFTMVVSKKLSVTDYYITAMEKEILKEHFDLLMYLPLGDVFDGIVLTNASFWKALYCSIFQRISNI